MRCRRCLLLQMMYSRLATATLSRTRVYSRRLLSTERKGAAPPPTTASEPKKTTWWTSAELWGGMGALAGWGMSGAAIYDATLQGPEVISLNMTCVLIVYSSLFARWAWVVQPRNTLLAACHVANIVAQSNQLRRALDYKLSNGQDEQVKEFVNKAAMVGALMGKSTQSKYRPPSLGICSLAPQRSMKA